MEIKTFDKGISHFRYVAVNGRVASWLTVIDYRMRIGSADVKMGAIAFVETKPAHRMKGYMRALMEDAVRYLTDRDYVVSVVSGIADFYGKFGYVSSLPDYELTVSARNAERAGLEAKRGRKFTTRKFRRGDAEHLLAIHDANTAGQACALVRNPEYFAGYPKARQEIVVVEDGRRRVVAYAVCNRSGDRVHVHELAANTEAAFPILAGRLARLAIKRRAGQITLALPAGDPFARFCQRQGCRWTITHHRNASAMMRIIDQDRLFRALSGDFGRRLRRSAFRRFSGSLRFRTDLGATTIRITTGSARVVANGRGGAVIRLKQGPLSQLIAGYRTVRDVLTEAGARVPAKTESLLSVLFPTPNAWTWDRSRFEEANLTPDDLPL